MVFKTSSARPGVLSRLERDKSREVESIEIDRETVKRRAIRLSQLGNKEPSWRNDDGDARVRFRMQLKEFSSSRVSLLQMHALRRKLVNQVVELEFRDHKELMCESTLFHLLSCRQYF